MAGKLYPDHVGYHRSSSGICSFSQEQCKPFLLCTGYFLKWPPLCSNVLNPDRIYTKTEKLPARPTVFLVDMKSLNLGSKWHFSVWPCCPPAPWLPLFLYMSGHGLHGASSISSRPPSKVNPPMSDWIVRRVMEPDSSLLHKGKDKLPISPGAGGRQDRVHLSVLLTMYKSLPQFSMQEVGEREREQSDWGWLAVQNRIKDLTLGSKAGYALLSMQREQSPMPRGSTETNAHWLQEGAICFSGVR